MNAFDLLQKVIILVLVCSLLTACGTPQVASTPTLSSPQSTLTSQSTLKPCEGETPRAEPGYTLVEPGTKAEILWHTGFVPFWVHSSPDGRVLAVTNHDDTIYELKPDGSLSTVFQCPGVIIETVAAASDGALWFATRHGGKLYRVDPDGTVRVMVLPYLNHYLEAGLNGSVYAMENGLVRIDPDGTAKLITHGLNGHLFAIGPKGEIVGFSNGNIVRVSDTGEITKIASGYMVESGLTFGPDGLLYVTYGTGVDTIDLETGTISTISWLNKFDLSANGTFAPDGRLLFYHENEDVLAADLVMHTISVFHEVHADSFAMAADPLGHGVYIAFGNNIANGKTTVYRVVDEHTLKSIANVPFGNERSMAFDSQGEGYLAVGDLERGGAIFRFDPASGDIVKYYESQCFPSGITVDPQTNQIWWEECNQFKSLGENGNLTVMDGIPDAEYVPSLAISQTGEFFTIAFFKRPDLGQPAEHRLYHWIKTDSTWEEVADLTQSDPKLVLATLVGCPDGRIYTVESLDASHVPSRHNSFNAVRRLEADGTLTLLGYDFSYDGLAAYCDPATGKILFTSNAGIFALTPP